MTDSADEDWSTPSLYSRGDMIEPRMFTEADPMGTALLGDWDRDWDRDAVVGERWSTTTYSGPRRLRPGTTPAAETIDRRGADRLDDTIVAPRPADAPVADVPVATPPAETDLDERSNRNLLSHSRSMAVASLTSRVTGFLRSVLLVAALGVGQVGNAYNAGNNLPNMIYELLLGGVLSSVLIPLLVRAQDEDADEGMAYTQRLLSIATAALAALTLASVALAPFIAGYFVKAGPQRNLTSIFATLLLPEIFFYGLGAMFMAVLNIKHVYKPGAWAPVLNNMIMIVTVLIFWVLPGPKTLNPSTMTSAQIVTLGLGTTLGIAAQALILVPSLRKVGFHWAWRFRASPGEAGRMRELGTIGGWVLAYVLASQVGVTVIQKVGITNGGFSVFTQADLLFQMPYGILVVSLLTAIMPRLSRAAVRGDHQSVIADLALGSRLSAVTLIPITAGLIALGVPLTVTLFAHGQTSLDGARLIGSSLALSAFGLLPFAFVMLQLRVFYAMRDGRTPTLINAFMVATKVALVLITNAVYRAPAHTNVNVHPSVHAVEWLNIATSFSYLVGAVVGHIALSRRLGHLGFRAVFATIVRISVASAIAAATAYLVVLGSYGALGRGHVGSVTGLVGGSIVGLAVLPLIAHLLRIGELREVVSFVRRR